MPLTPSEQGGGGGGVIVETSLNLGGMVPSGGRSILSDTAIPTGIAILNDNLFVVADLTGQIFREYSMTNGLPESATLTGNVLPVPGLAVGGITYDATNGRIYFQDRNTTRFRQLDLIGGTLAGATLSPLFRDIGWGNGWGLGVSPDGDSLFICDGSGISSDVRRYDFGVAGEISSINFGAVRDMLVGERLGSIIVSPSQLRYFMCTLLGTDFHVTDAIVPKSLAAASAANQPSHTFSAIPFAGSGIKFIAANASGTFVYLMSSTGRVFVRFSATGGLI